MQKSQKIENKILKVAVLIFLITLAILQIISIILSKQDITNGFAIGFIASLIGYKITIIAIDLTLQFNASFLISILFMFKMGIYAGVLIWATQVNYINIWSLFGSLFIIKIATYKVQLGGKENG